MSYCQNCADLERRAEQAEAENVRLRAAGQLALERLKFYRDAIIDLWKDVTVNTRGGNIRDQYDATSEGQLAAALGTSREPSPPEPCTGCYSSPCICARLAEPSPPPEPEEAP